MASSRLGDALYERQRKAVLKSTYNSFFKKVFVCAVVIGVLLSFLFGVYRVDNNDMYPALKDGDIVLYYKFVGKYAGRDVIVYDKNSERHVGRIIGLDNAYIDKESSGQLVVGSHILPRDDAQGIYYDTEAFDTLEYPFSLRDNEYFVLSDRRQEAVDSRILGPINKEDIEGKVFTVFRKRGI